MGLGYDIGDRVMQIEDKVIGKVMKFYFPTACAQQTMILCDDGRKYHAPSDTFIKREGGVESENLIDNSGNIGNRVFNRNCDNFADDIVESVHSISKGI